MSALPAQDLLASLAMAPLRQRPPWIGGDLQTLRDTLRPVRLPASTGRSLRLPLPSGEHLHAVLDAPIGAAEPAALVLLVHGLGGSSEREGLRRMGLALQEAGLAVLRLNLRGVGAGRSLAAGTYAAACSTDLLPVLAQLRSLAADRPLLGVGLSLGGTIRSMPCSRRQRWLASMVWSASVLPSI